MVQDRISQVLQTTRNYLDCYDGNDDLQIVAAFADPNLVSIGVTIQDEYPLGHIERRYGIPFGRLRHQPTKVISDAERLHGLKMSMDAHQREFQLDAAIQKFVEAGVFGGSVEVILSTGIGNVLQNKRSVAYKNRKLYFVEGETPAHPPYVCLIQYSDRTTANEYNHHDKPSRQVDVAVLSFTQNGGWGCELFDAGDYISSDSKKLGVLDREFQDKIRWAVSGYPLLINGQRVYLERIAENVSDYFTTVHFFSAKW